MLDDILKKLYDSLFHEREYELTEAKKAKLFLLELSDQNDPEALSFGGLYFKPHYNETDEIDA